MRLVLNMIWLIPGGFWPALKRMVSAAVPIVLPATIVGIPLTLADLKQIPVSLVPLGVEIDPADSPGRLDRVLI